MALQQLDAGLLHSGFINACHAIILQRETLNAINVFPVADGDTGNNMAATAEAVINHATLQPTLAATLQEVANAAIMGARGNSGMIFSQFFNGLLEMPLPEEIDTRQFADLIHLACKSVRGAIANPVEGTILTVMEVWAQSLAEHAPSNSCFNVLLKKTVADAEQALQSTTNTLALLKDAQVVDAGALGFTLFIQGFSSYLANPTQIQETRAVMVSEQHNHEIFTPGNPPTRRYCTEALLMGDAIDKAQLSGLLQEHGDSIVLTANKNLSRFHVHSNEPWKIFTALRDIGQVRYPKVDDMLRQYQFLHAPKARIALLTDTSANIPQDLLDQYQIHLIALNIQIDDHHLLDKYSLDSASFYESLRGLQTYPTSSCPSPAFIAEKIKHLAEQYDDVLVISVSAALSGTYNAMNVAAKAYPNVHVINSCHVSGSQGLLVNHAAELIADGLSINAIKNALLDKIGKTHLLIMVDQFESLIRSGRISKLKGKFAQFTGMKPILSLDEEGHGIIFDKAFNETKALSKIVNTVKELSRKEGLDNYCIIHAGAPEKAAEFAHMTSDAFGHAPAFIEPVSTAIGLHAGRGCVAIAAMLN
jgi:uncharacterized protein